MQGGWCFLSWRRVLPLPVPRCSMRCGSVYRFPIEWNCCASFALIDLRCSMSADYCCMKTAWGCVGLSLAPWLATDPVLIGEVQTEPRHCGGGGGGDSRRTHSIDPLDCSGNVIRALRRAAPTVGWDLLKAALYQLWSSALCRRRPSVAHVWDRDPAHASHVAFWCIHRGLWGS